MEDNFFEKYLLSKFSEICRVEMVFPYAFQFAHHANTISEIHYWAPFSSPSSVVLFYPTVASFGDVTIKKNWWSIFPQINWFLITLELLTVLWPYITKLHLPFLHCPIKSPKTAQHVSIFQISSPKIYLLNSASFKIDRILCKGLDSTLTWRHHESNAGKSFSTPKRSLVVRSIAAMLKLRLYLFVDLFL